MSGGQHKERSHGQEPRRRLGRSAQGQHQGGVGNLTGDQKLKAEGHADQTGGKIKNAVGGAAVKDAASDAKHAVDRKTDGNPNT
jgi:uncharacterized protein YjbJ (UPF0337 family)